MLLLSMFVFSLNFSFVGSVCVQIPGTVTNLSLQGYTFLKTNITGKHQCMRLCSQYKICKSLNFLQEQYICELNSFTIANYSSDVFHNTVRIYVDKIYIPKVSKISLSLIIHWHVKCNRNIDSFYAICLNLNVVDQITGETKGAGDVQ